MPAELVCPRNFVPATSLAVPSEKKHVSPSPAAQLFSGLIPFHGDSCFFATLFLSHGLPKNLLPGGCSVADSPSRHLPSRCDSCPHRHTFHVISVIACQLLACQFLTSTYNLSCTSRFFTTSKGCVCVCLLVNHSLLLRVCQSRVKQPLSKILARLPALPSTLELTTAHPKS